MARSKKGQRRQHKATKRQPKQPSPQLVAAINRWRVEYVRARIGSMPRAEIARVIRVQPEELERILYKMGFAKIRDPVGAEPAAVHVSPIAQDLRRAVRNALRELTATARADPRILYTIENWPHQSLRRCADDLCIKHVALRMLLSRCCPRVVPGLKAVRAKLYRSYVGIAVRQIGSVECAKQLGITRAVVVEIAKKQGIRLNNRLPKRHDLAKIFDELDLNPEALDDIPRLQKRTGLHVSKLLAALDATRSGNERLNRYRHIYAVLKENYVKHGLYFCEQLIGESKLDLTHIAKEFGLARKDPTIPAKTERTRRMVIRQHAKHGAKWCVDNLGVSRGRVMAIVNDAEFEQPKSADVPQDVIDRTLRRYYQTHGGVFCAKKLGIRKIRAAQRAWRLGLKAPKHDPAASAPTPFEKVERALTVIKTAQADNKTIAQIKDETGLTGTIVLRALSLAGVKPRRSTRAVEVWVPGTRTRHWDDNRVQFVRDNFGKLSARQLADRLKVPLLAVYDLTQRLGIKRHLFIDYGWTEEQMVQLMRLSWEKRATPAEIESTMKMSRQQIRLKQLQLGFHHTGDRVGLACAICDPQVTLTMRELATQFGMNMSTVRKLMTVQGVAPRRGVPTERVLGRVIPNERINNPVLPTSYDPVLGARIRSLAGLRVPPVPKQQALPSSMAQQAA